MEGLLVFAFLGFIVVLTFFPKALPGVKGKRMHCPNCDELISLSAKVCPYCRTRLDRDQNICHFLAFKSIDSIATILVIAFIVFVIANII